MEAEELGVSLQEVLAGPAQATLLLLKVAIDTSNALQVSTEASDLRDVTTAALLRSTQTIQSIVSLANNLFVEEIWIVTRSLTELAINTCYLQTAVAEELKRFINYDSITDAEWHRQLAQIDGIRTKLDGIEGHRAKAAAMIAYSEQLEKDGLYDKTLRGTWSNKGLDQRATQVDAQLGNGKVPTFRLLYRMVVKHADSYVHASPKSLGFYRDWVDSGKPKRNKERFQDAASGICMATAAFHAMTSYLRNIHHLGKHTSDEQISALLDTAFARMDAEGDGQRSSD